VNNAGISRPQPLGEITEQDSHEILATNLKSLTGQTLNVNGGWYMS
jgi:NAD(P)-dependent dehydrogenase (short-subunit alcohol dehydrogenase family)